MVINSPSFGTVVTLQRQQQTMLKGRSLLQVAAANDCSYIMTYMKRVLIFKQNVLVLFWQQSQIMYMYTYYMYLWTLDITVYTSNI